jgi:hypothetical protein
MNRPLAAASRLLGETAKRCSAGRRPSRQRCWKCTLRNGLTHGQRHGCNNERHDQALGNLRDHKLAAVHIDLRGSAILALSFLTCNLAERRSYSSVRMPQK